MAGGVLKGFGGVLLALSILGLLAAVAGVIYAAMDQEENEDAGPFGVGEDPDRSRTNEDLLLGSLLLGGACVVTLVVSILLLVGGGARARRSLERAVAAQGAPPPAAAPNAPKEADGAADRTGIAIAAVILGAAIVAAVLIIALRGGPGGSFLESSPEERLLATAEEDGRMEATLTLLGTSNSAASSAVPLQAPEGTDRVELAVDWTPEPMGAQRLQVYLERDVGGAWEVLTEAVGAPGVTLEHFSPDLSGASLRVRVFPGEDGASQGQGFHVAASFFGA